MRAWIERAVTLQRELAAIAEVDPRWWALAAGVALVEPWAPPEVYLACDAEPDADTLMATPRPPDAAGRDPVEEAIAEAIDRAKAARQALRELDGELPDQPLAVTIDRAGGGTVRPSSLEVAAFAVGDGCVVGRIDDVRLPDSLRAAVRGERAAPGSWRSAAEVPFVCVALGEEPLATARHGHRRGWLAGMNGGPWLGLSRSAGARGAAGLDVVSTCHLVVDGYGHARLSARLAELGAAQRARRARAGASSPAPATSASGALPPLAAVAGGLPLTIAWRLLERPAPRAIALAYQLGRLLHRNAGDRRARFSPTFQLPVARGKKDDPLRLRRRIVAATASVRFDEGEAEPFEVFEERMRQIIAREAMARGLVSRLLAAARAVPVPVAWKRRSISAKRAAWLDGFAEVIGGRAMLSRIALDVPLPPLCAASSPARMATEEDPAGGCVITIVEGKGSGPGVIAIAGSGFIGSQPQAQALLDELLAAPTATG